MAIRWSFRRYEIGQSQDRAPLSRAKPRRIAPQFAFNRNYDHEILCCRAATHTRRIEFGMPLAEIN
jgi:hypothetical protein